MLRFISKYVFNNHKFININNRQEINEWSRSSMEDRVMLELLHLIEKMDEVNTYPNVYISTQHV